MRTHLCTDLHIILYLSSHILIDHHIKFHNFTCCHLCQFPLSTQFKHRHSFPIYQKGWRRKLADPTLVQQPQQPHGSSKMYHYCWIYFIIFVSNPNTGWSSTSPPAAATTWFINFLPLLLNFVFHNRILSDFVDFLTMIMIIMYHRVELAYSPSLE